MPKRKTEYRTFSPAVERVLRGLRTRRLAIPSERLLAARGTLTREDFAPRIGVSVKSLQNFERGRIPASTPSAEGERWYAAEFTEAAMWNVLGFLLESNVPVGRRSSPGSPWVLDEPGSVALPSDASNEAPASPVGLHGRESERGLLALWAKAPAIYLLSGPPGVGKSALARAVYRGNSARWVDLDAAPVSLSVARCLGLPLGASDDQLGRALAASDIRVLVLDGLEQGPGPLPEWSRLANRIAFVVLARGRPELPLRAELALGPVSPTAARAFFPAASEPGGVDALADAVGRLPLALELAAAWAASVGTAAVLDDLAQLARPPTGAEESSALWRTLSGAWARLSSEQQWLLEDLAGAQGLLTTDAAEALARPGAGSTIHLLNGLVTLGFATRPRAGAFRVSAVVRAFARARGATPDPHRYASWFGRHAPHLAELDQLDGAERRASLSAEMDDALQATVHDSPALSAVARVAAAALALGGAHARASTLLLEIEPRVPEGERPTLALAAARSARLAGLIDAAEAGFGRARASADPSVRMGAWLGLTALANERRDTAEARRCLDRARAELQAGAAVPASVHGTEAAVLFREGRTTEAELLMDRAREAAHDAGDARTEAVMLSNLSMLLQANDRLVPARKYAENALRLVQAIGNRGSELVSWVNLVSLHADLGQPDDASKAAVHGAVLARRTGDSLSVARLLCNRAFLEILRGATGVAEGSLEEAERALRCVQDAQFMGTLLGNRGHIALLHEHWAGADALYERALSLPGNPGARAWLLAGRVRCALEERRHADALAMSRSETSDAGEAARVRLAMEAVARLLASDARSAAAPLRIALAQGVLLRSAGSPSGALLTLVWHALATRGETFRPLTRERLELTSPWVPVRGLIPVLLRGVIKTP